MPKKDTEEPKGNTVTITSEQWSEVLNRLSAAEARSGAGKVEKPIRITQHTANLRFHEGKPVVRMDNFQEKLIDGRKTAFIDLYVIDNHNPFKVEYLDFLNSSNAQKVKILKQTAREHIKNDGTVRAINPDPLNVKTWDGGLVDLEVKSFTYDAEVEVLEGDNKGEVFTVPTSALNS